MENLFNSSFVLGFGLDQSTFKSSQGLTLNQSSKILFPALHFQTQISVLNFSFLNNNASSVNLQSTLEQKT